MLHVVHLADVNPQPWKNGGGVTQELLTWPNSSGADWHVRVSVATIAADGPFSPFPGIHRWFAVLEGAGVRLTHGARSIECRVGDKPWLFNGAEAPACTLLGGPTRDLNLMLRGRGSLVSVVEESHLHTAALWRGLFSWQPCTLHAGEIRHDLSAGTLAWSDVLLHEPWRCTGATEGAFWLSLNARSGH